ncbi:MAG: guanylate kinase [Candidatus Cloacimonetes bacterium]|nr:guanylate kinase [Candidatus Cloacimonadota bacterium]MBL7107814.1 guanylate kinase [Candidatus Cloacimonadota bacterium]
MRKKKYFPIIISSPSGGGKSSICDEILKKNSDITYSISYTTRKPRKNEKNGVDYFFITKNEFLKMRKKGEFIEWAKVHNFYYGTSKKFIENTLSQKKFIILDIDTEGAKKFVKELPETFSVFLFPPNMKKLELRLRKRKTDSEKVIQLRLKNAKKEFNEAWWYNLLIVNDEIPRVVKKILSEIKIKSEGAK